MDGESQNAQDERVEKLWQDLDTRKEGQLDMKALKKGLRKIDHREYGAICASHTLMVRAALKNADGMLRDVFKAVDISGDGRIQYSGRRYFGRHL